MSYADTEALVYNSLLVENLHISSLNSPQSLLKADKARSSVTTVQNLVSKTKNLYVFL